MQLPVIGEIGAILGQGHWAIFRRMAQNVSQNGPKGQNGPKRGAKVILKMAQNVFNQKWPKKCKIQ